MPRVFQAAQGHTPAPAPAPVVVGERKKLLLNAKKGTKASKQAKQSYIACSHTQKHTQHTPFASPSLSPRLPHALPLAHALALAHPHALPEKQPSRGEVVPVARKDEKTRIFFQGKTRMSCFCVELL